MADPTPVTNLVPFALPPWRYKLAVQAGIRADPRLTGYQKMVGQMFVDFMADDRTTWVTFEKIKAELGFNRKTIVLAVAALKRWGYLVPVSRAVPHRAPHYMLEMGSEPAPTDRRACAGRGRKRRAASDPSISTSASDPSISRDDVVPPTTRPIYFPQRDPSNSAASDPSNGPLSFEVSRDVTRARARARATTNGWQPREGSAAARALDDKHEAPTAPLIDEEEQPADDDDMSDFCLWAGDDPGDLVPK